MVSECASVANHELERFGITIRRSPLDDSPSFF